MFDIRQHDTTPAAPGDLEILQRFLNLHEHEDEDGPPEGVPPSPRMVRTFLVERGLLPADAPYSEPDHQHALALYDALHGRLRPETTTSTAADEDLGTIEETAARAGLRIRFASGEPTLEPQVDGVDAALGRLVALLFLADLDGGWSLMKECASESCHSVFFDRSKNHSGKWCSMQACGNRHKVRAWRERHRFDAVDV